MASSPSGTSNQRVFSLPRLRCGSSASCPFGSVQRSGSPIASPCSSRFWNTLVQRSASRNLLHHLGVAPPQVRAVALVLLGVGRVLGPTGAELEVSQLV